MRLENFVNVMGINVVQVIDTIQRCQSSQDRPPEPDDYLNANWIKIITAKAEKKSFSTVEVKRTPEKLKGCNKQTDREQNGLANGHYAHSERKEHFPTTEATTVRPTWRTAKRLYV